MADKKKSPYDFNNDPYGDARMRGDPLQMPPRPKGPDTTVQKQRKKTEEAMSQYDPVSNAVRSLWKKVRGN